MIAIYHLVDVIWYFHIDKDRHHMSEIYIPLTPIREDPIEKGTSGNLKFA